MVCEDDGGSGDENGGVTGLAEEDGEGDGEGKTLNGRVEHIQIGPTLPTQRDQVCMYVTYQRAGEPSIGC